MGLTFEIVLALIQSEEEYPVDFDDAWKWIGYSTKGNAKAAFDAAGFIENVDYKVFMINHKNSNGGRPRHKIMLTVDAFKMFCMMAGTDKGRQVRVYFLNCEAELKRRIQQEREQHKQRVVAAFVDEKHSSWKKRFEDEFFEEAYRVTGWKVVAKGHAPCMGNFVNRNVYSWFPEGVTERLDEVNPRINGRLKHKKHQYLKNPGLVFLETQKTAVLAVMRLSPDNNPKKFSQNLDKALGSAVQLEIPFLDDL